MRADDLTKELPRTSMSARAASIMSGSDPMSRFAQILDPGSCDELPAPKVPEDPLKFRDSKKYGPTASAPPAPPTPNRTR